MAFRRVLASLVAVATSTTALVGVATAPPADAAVATTLRWTKEIPGGIIRESSPMAVNLDGSKDIVVGARNGNLYALRPDGTDVAGWPRALGDGIDGSPAAADTNGDGAQELFIGSGTGAAPSGNLFSLTRTGATRWSFHPSDADFPNLAMFSSPAIGDVTGDGVADVSGFSLGLKGWSFSEGGALNSGWPFYQDDTTFSSPALVDVDGDGLLDYVVGGDSSPGGPTDIRGGVLRAIRGDGSLIWQVPFDEMVRSSPSVGDIDGDGKGEIVVGTGDYWARQSGGSTDQTKIFAFNFDGTRKWVRDLGGQTMASPTLADVNGDGRLDVIEPTWGGGNGGKVFVLDGASGNSLAGWDGRSSGGGAVLGQVTTADLDNDGGQDLLVPTGAGVWAFSGKSGAQLFSVQTGIAAYQNSPLITDLDGNGTLSLVIAGTRPDNTALISRYDLPTTAKFGSLNWSQFRKDNAHSGSWIGAPAPVDYCAPAPNEGYWLTAADGGVFSYCNAPFHGAAAASKPGQPIVGLTRTPSGRGYWQVARDGGIFAYGDAAFYGSTGATRLNQPIVGMAATPTGRGYWLVASDGGIFAFGDAAFYGSTGATPLNQPIVGMASTTNGGGYWLVAADGGIFAFGNAAFRGSTGAIKLNQPIVAMTTTASGNGYWMVASDGGIFAFGDAPFHGSTGAIKLNQPIVGMSRNTNGTGYRMVARDGGIFAFNASFLGSAGRIRLNQPIVGMATN